MGNAVRLRRVWRWPGRYAPGQGYSPNLHYPTHIATSPTSLLPYDISLETQGPTVERCGVSVNFGGNMGNVGELWTNSAQAFMPGPHLPGRAGRIRALAPCGPYCALSLSLPSFHVSFLTSKLIPKDPIHRSTFHGLFFNEIIFCITNEISFTIISLSSSDKFFLESGFFIRNYYYITNYHRNLLRFTLYIRS